MKFEETLFEISLDDKKHLNGQLRLFKARGGATVVAQVATPWSIKMGIWELICRQF